MIKLLRIGLLSALVVVLVSISGAQTNLLQNGDFDQPGGFNIIMHSQEQGTMFGVPPGWGGWLATLPHTQDWMNLVPDGYPHTGLFKRDGVQSLHISRGFATFTTAVHQRVSVAAGTNVRGSVQGFMERGSNPPPGAQFRIGIDPNGGTDPLSGAIVWGPWVSTPNSWVDTAVEATAVGDAVTLFLYSTQSSPSNPNGIYWDNAVLAVGGSGGGVTVSGTPGTAIPVNIVPTPAFAPFVMPQGARPDGSIVHTVVAGDTLDAIAVAYRTTREELLKLNNLPSRTFLMIGQEIIVSPAGTVVIPTAPTGNTTGTGNNTGTNTGTVDGAGTLVARASGTREVSTQVATATPTATPQQAATTAAPQPTATTQPPSATPEPSPTSAPTEEPAPTDLPAAPVTEVAQLQPSPDVTALCLWMFDDANKNRIQEGSESLLVGGRIEISQGDALLHSVDSESAEICFYDVQPGDYTASASAPDGYGLTTAGVLNLRVQGNARTNVRFGAAEGVATAVPPTEVAQIATQPPAQPVDESADSSNLLQISGLLLVGLAGVVILGGIGLALFIRGR